MIYGYAWYEDSYDFNCQRIGLKKLGAVEASEQGASRFGGLLLYASCFTSDRSKSPCIDSTGYVLLAMRSRVDCISFGVLSRQ